MLIGAAERSATATEKAAASSALSADAAGRAADASERAVEAAARPVLIVAEHRVRSPASHPEVDYALRNIGSGPAIDIRVAVVTLDEPKQWDAESRHPPIPPGETFPPTPPQGSAGPRLVGRKLLNEDENPDLKPWLAAIGSDKWGLIIVCRDIWGVEHRAQWRADTGEWALDEG